MRTRFDTESPIVTHPRAAALYYTPLPASITRQLARLTHLLRHAPNLAEAEWLDAQIDAITVDCADCPPVHVRNVSPRPTRRRHEHKYWNAQHGPTNKSGRAKS